MGKEIELKFLLAKGSSIPIPANHKKLKIKQAYIVAEKGLQVRVRITEEPIRLQSVNGIRKSAFIKSNIGIKFTGGIIRDEFEYEIPLNEAKEIYKKCKWKIAKNRLSFSVGSSHYDVDTFSNGMIFVEVEFKSVKAMKAWKKPKWLGKEITGVGKYSNIVIAKKKTKKR